MFMICVDRRCFLPLLSAFVLKCRVYCIILIHITLVVAYTIFSACFNCLSVHTSTFHPVLAHPHLCMLLLIVMYMIKHLFMLFN